MAPGADPAFQAAMDKLLLQVDADNVLAVHRAFRNHADELLAYLNQARTSVNMGLCGGDPVSHAVLKDDSLAGKARKLFEVHWKHWEELDAVAWHLIDTARLYGRAEDEIRQELDKSRPQR